MITSDEYDAINAEIIMAKKRPFMRPEDDPRNWPIYANDILDKKNYLYFMEEFVGRFDISKL